MVKPIHLQELIENDDIAERNKSLRRAFSSYTETIDVTGSEEFALVILLNLTYRKNQVDDLLDKKLAKVVLNSEEKISKCIEEVQWFHTHNLKYPDIRVSKQNLAVDSPVLHPYVLSSANYPKGLGWTHNSAQVNFAKLFVSYFYWQGSRHCLADILTSPIKEWKVAFQALGMPVKYFVNVCGRIKGYFPEQVMPSNVDKYSPQVRMPYHDGYLSITPVVSHVVQSKLQQAATLKQGKFSKISFTRSAAVSEMVASLGGFVNTLNYPPFISNKHYGLHNSRLLQMKNGKTVFNCDVLVKKQFINALDGLIFIGGEMALKQRRKKQMNSLKQIRVSLSEWLTPMLEWRLEVMSNTGHFNQLEIISGTIEYQLLSLPDPELPSLTIPAFTLLNTMLLNSDITQKYAFHPKLMSSLKGALKWLLGNFTNELCHFKPNTSLSDDNDEQFRYLHLKGIRVFDALALSNPYCTGTPSLTAVWGMMHRYQRQLNEALGTRIRFTSFSWFIHSYSLNSGKKLPEISLQGAKQNELRRPGIVDNKHCDLVFDLVVHIDGYEEDLLLLDENTNMLKAHFPSTLAGGVMHPPELSIEMNWCQLHSDEDSLFEKLRRLPLSGRWIMPTAYKIDDLTALLLMLSNNSDLSPTMLGYLLLDKPKVRSGSIDKYHCYAEPAIGIIEYITAIQIRLKGKRNYFNKAFWMLDTQEQFMLLKGL